MLLRQPEQSSTSGLEGRLRYLCEGKEELLLLIPVTKKEMIRGSLDVFRIFIEVYYTYRKDTCH